MTRVSPAAALLVGLAVAHGGAPQPARGVRAQAAPPAAPAPKPPSEFRLARAKLSREHGDPQGFEFEMNGFSYSLKANGNGRRVKGGTVRGFNLRLEEGGLGRVYFAPYGGGLLLVCEAGGGEAGRGFVTLLEQPSMRGRWRREYPAFNVGEPLREGHALYVTGVGFVGRLDLRTGEFDWRHDDLYDQREGAPKHFASFEAPEVAGDAVLFRERPVYNPGKTVVVEKKTGRIIRVE